MKKRYTFLILLFTVFISNAQIVNIPDANFKAKLLAASPSQNIAYNSSNVRIKIDINNDGEIQVSEALAVYYLNVASSSIQNLTGIEAFSNLRTLDCSTNQLTNLDVSQNTALTDFNCDNNQLTSLDVSQNSALISLYCSSNQLTNLNVVQNILLENLNCAGNQLTSIDVTQNLVLITLVVSNNPLTSLDITHNSLLFTLGCVNNQLSNLDITQNTLLHYLNCNNNQLSNLDITQNINLNSLRCESNQLTTLDVTKNTVLTTLNCSNNDLVTLLLKNKYVIWVILNFSNNPYLQYVCGDDESLAYLEQKITQYGYINCHVNSYCTFEPGGTFYTIQGNNKFDSNNNGCDANDIVLPNQKFTITNGSISGEIIADQTGNYSIPVQQGSHTITPVFENPSYFTISPSFVNVSFPAATSPFIQDFCITANGVINDLEVTIIPIGPALPGFDAHYRIIYKNKGNQVSNGSLNFTFDDAIMDLVSVTPVNDNAATNTLSWNYGNLVSLETREIDLIFNINSPMEIPAVNANDVLDYTATIVGATDETPNDNTFTLNQTVVNSYDPNDKTCLEGATITPSMVGQYVHYVIRFENTGTFAAENIVVKDMIDTTKFDVSTLIPQHSSHDFFTRINGNKVEFIFENINLPFDDANNDGYVAFKIKTKPTLVLGNTFTNSASIYFDYNFPIVTDPAVTTVALLNTNDFDFGTYFSLYPNPAKDVLNFEVKNEIGVKSVSVYNTLGQIVMAITNVDNLKSIDVSSLTAGSYFVKVYTDKGSSSSKFIKQ
ncbi:MAG: T9SS type A sorting domain-containing protein [Flavobacterium sp.]|uniref:DUF7619 domain-containing protein n=1 Tax=Flavobacterium sp. TaxID=239 RepID=UPI0022BAA84E|nr:T9SS type A sorting domain-containing protein [Flavobacterium sp.]MCZ8331641.1 T9SS type A sorting domain-containing protein [Flavobacterium sp.]